MNNQTCRMSIWLRNSTDDDEANPWITTQWFGINSVSVDDADMVAATSGAAPFLFWNFWHNASTSTPGTGGLKATLPTGIEAYRVESQWRISTGFGEATGTSEWDIPTTQPTGSRTGTIAPQPLAVILRKGVTSGLKKHRGRNYLPCLAADVNQDGSIVSGTRTALAAAMTPLLSNGQLAPDFPLIVAGSDGQNRLVSLFDVAPLVGVQRRRLR